MPQRWAFRAILFVGLSLLAVVPTVSAQTGPADEIVFRDPATGKVEAVKTAAKDSPAGVAYVEGKTNKLVSPTDVVVVNYGTLPGVSDGDRLTARSREADPAQTPAAMQQLYADLLKKLPATNADEKTRRVLGFREAYWAAKVADAKAGDDFAKEAPAVVKRIEDSMKFFTKSWEAWPATRMLARIHTELGDHEKAAAAWDRVAKVPDLPAPLKLEARVAELAATIRAGGGLGAEAAVEQLAKEKDVPATGPIPDRIAVLRAAAKVPLPKQPGEAVKVPPDVIAKLEAAINQVKDPGAKAIGHNFLGDAHRLSGATREAMWSYLWVDVVYGGDATEGVYALSHLIRLFEAANDTERADQFREKLPRVR